MSALTEIGHLSLEGTATKQAVEHLAQMAVMLYDIYSDGFETPRTSAEWVPPAIHTIHPHEGIAAGGHLVIREDENYLVLGMSPDGDSCVSLKIRGFDERYYHEEIGEGQEYEFALASCRFTRRTWREHRSGGVDSKLEEVSLSYLPALPVQRVADGLLAQNVKTAHRRWHAWRRRSARNLPPPRPSYRPRTSQ